jgi:hypothetical protein
MVPEVGAGPEDPPGAGAAPAGGGGAWLVAAPGAEVSTPLSGVGGRAAADAARLSELVGASGD